jgi:hypothetical protein
MQELITLISIQLQCNGYQNTQKHLGKGFQQNDFYIEDRNGKRCGANNFQRGGIATENSEQAGKTCRFYLQHHRRKWKYCRKYHTFERGITVLRKIRFIVQGNRWNDIFGNTYHTCRIEDCKTGVIYNVQRTYGYGDCYQYSAFELLIKEKLVRGCKTATQLVEYQIKKNYPILFTVQDVSRKKDL